MIDISFIIINYKTKDITENCILSIQSNKYLKNLNYEIILVDNNSNDGSYEFFTTQNHNNTIIIKNDFNEGFGVANNIGVKYSKGKYIVLLNSDTLVDETEFDKLINLIVNNKEIGVLSAKILNHDSSIQSLGFQFPNLINEIKLNLFFWNFNFMKSIRYKNYIDKGLYRTDWVSGAFMIIRKNDFILADGFDPSIFMYAEDLDLCYRLSEMEKYSYVFDKTSVYHLHGKSGIKSDISIKKLIEKRKPYYYVMRKNQMVNLVNIPIIKFSYLVNAIFLVLYKKLKNKIG